jgi:WD40 repeat protein/uncharacterized protein YjbI with pentapeptide repeats
MSIQGVNMPRAYTEKQLRFVHAFMLKFDTLWHDEMASDDYVSQGLDTAETLTNTAAAGVVIIGVAAAPVTAGTSLGVAAGLLATGAACVVLAKAGHNAYKVVTRTLDKKSNAFDEGETTFEERRLMLSIRLRELADLVVVRYRHVIDEMMEEGSIMQFALYGAERIIKKLKEEIHTPSGATSLVKECLHSPQGIDAIHPQQLLDYLMQSTRLSIKHASEKVSIKDSLLPISLLSPSNAHTKWVYARPRIAFYETVAPFGLQVGFYESTRERMYLSTTTTLPYGYITHPLNTPFTPNITQGDRVLKTSANTAELNQYVLPNLCISYPITRDEVEMYLNDLRGLTINRPSLNDYISQKIGMHVIAECHDNRLQDLDLSTGIFVDVNFRHINLEGCNLADTVWDYAHLEGAQFKSNSLDNARFQHVFLQKTLWHDITFNGDFSHADLSASTIKHCTFGSQFQDKGTCWLWVDLQEVSLDNTMMETLTKRLNDEQKERIEQNMQAIQSMREWEANEEARWQTQKKINESVLKRLDSIEQRPVKDLLKKIRAHGEGLFNAAVLQPYVELIISSMAAGENRPVPLWNRLDQFLNDPQESFFLLHGEIGSGKSLSVHLWQQELMHIYQDDDDWLPVTIKLKQVQDQTCDNILDTALQTILSQEQITTLKAHFKCVIILDGLDECGIDFSERYFLEECLQTASQWRQGMPKIMVTTQTRLLVEQNYRELLRIGAEKIKFPLESTYVIQPLNHAQIDTYLRENYWLGVNLTIQDPRFQEIRQWMTSPMTLHIACEVLHASDPAAQLPTSLVALYDEFFRNWFNHVKSKLPNEHFTYKSIQLYIQRIAYQMFAERTKQIERPYEAEVRDVLEIQEDRSSEQHTPESFAILFDNPVWKKAGSLTPISVTLNTSKRPLTLSYEFRHASFRHYALAKYLVETFNKLSGPQLLSAWNYDFLTRMPPVFDFLQELLHAHNNLDEIQRALCEMVSSSKAQDGKQWETAASNAITLLSRLGFNFSVHTPPSWGKKIRIPNANLRRALLAYLDLSESDMRNVCLHEAVLAGTNMRDVNLENARFYDAPSFIYTKKHPETFAVYPSDERIIAYDVSKSSDSTQHKIMIVGVNGAIYPELSGHQDAILCMAWGVSGVEARLASAGLGGTIRVWRIHPKENRGEEIAKLKIEIKKAIRCLAWSTEARVLASGDDDGHVHIWDIDKKIHLYSYDNHRNPVRSVLWGQHRSIFLSAGEDGMIYSWSLHREALLLKQIRPNSDIPWLMPAHGRPLYALALSPDEAHVATGCSDGVIYINALKTTQLEIMLLAPMLKGHHEAVTSIIWRMCSLVSGSQDATVRVWDPETGTCKAIFQGDGHGIAQVSWLGKSRHVMAGGGGRSRMLSLWDTDAPADASPEMKGLTHRITSMAAHGDDLASGSLDGKVWLWNIKTFPVKDVQQIMSLDGSPVIHMAWSSGGQYLAALGKNSVIKIYEHTHGSASDETPELFLIRAEDEVSFHQITWITADSGESLLAVAASNGLNYVWRRNELDPTTWVLEYHLQSSEPAGLGTVQCISASPRRRTRDNTPIDSLGSNTPSSGSMDAETPSSGLTQLNSDSSDSPNDHSDTITSSLVTFDSSQQKSSPSNSFSSQTPNSDTHTSERSNAVTLYLATSNGALIDVWDLQRDHDDYPLKQCVRHTAMVTSLTWSPDGQFLASLDQKQVVFIWDTATWRCVFTEETQSNEKNIVWARMGHEKQCLLIGTSEKIQIFRANDAVFDPRPIKTIPFWAENLYYQAPLLFVVQRKSIDVLNLFLLLQDDQSAHPWVGRLGHGLCVQGLNLNNAQGLDDSTKELLQNNGAIVQPTEKKSSMFSWFGFYNNKPERLPPPTALKTTQAASEKISSHASKRHNGGDLSP